MIENIFNKVYEVVGTSDSNLLLKTSGGLKVKWGNKYIDLIKDGDVNYPKTAIIKLIEATALPPNTILLYEGNEAPEGWCKLEIDTNLPGIIYIKKI